jgi:hypothetical protein
LGGNTCKPLLITNTQGQKLVVKLPNREGKCQFILNELLAGKLLECLGLPHPEVSVVALKLPHPLDSTICNEEDQKIVAEARTILTDEPLVCFGRYKQDYHAMGGDAPVPALLPKVAFGAVVFDTGIFNEDARQFLGREIDGNNDLLLFDHDGAFNRKDWILDNKRDVRKDMHWTKLQNAIGDVIREGDLVEFEPWLRALEDETKWTDLRSFQRFIPPEWINHLHKNRRRTLDELLKTLDERRHQVREMLEKAGRC